MCKTLNLKNGRHFPLFGDLKNIIFVHRHWGAAPSGTNPCGNAPFGTAPPWALHRRARTLMGTHPSAQCPWNRTVGHEPLRERTLRHSPIIHQSIHHPFDHAINPIYIHIYGRWQTDCGPKADSGKPSQPYGRWQADSGPKADCGKPTHTLCIYICMHTSYTIIH